MYMYIYICNNDILLGGMGEGLQNKIINQSNKNDKAFFFHLIQFVSIFLRLTANIKEDRTGKISLRDIQSKMGKSISLVGLGRLMVKLYPEVKSKQERLISEWNKRESVFHGVKWRVEDNACSLEFLDILKYTETCFLIHKTYEEITVGMFTGDILNGNRLIAEIKFRIDLKWSVSVCMSCSINHQLFPSCEFICVILLYV